ncbi:MAG: hypothetical protein WDO74_28140 [Pseudomonadota bacterium]
MTISDFLRPYLEMNMPPSTPAAKLTPVLMAPSKKALSDSDKPRPPLASGACMNNGASTSRNPSPLRYRNTKISMPRIFGFLKKSITVSANVLMISAVFSGRRMMVPVGSMYE